MTVLLFLSFLLKFVTASASLSQHEQKQQTKYLRRKTSAQVPQHRNAIVGGSNAEPNRYPSVVYLADREDGLSCGGTLISPTVVLTAAHCEISLVIDAVIGRYHSSKASSSSFTEDTNGIERIRIVEEIQHPKYQSGTLEYDFMLLKLEHAPTSRDIPFMRLNGDHNMISSRIAGTALPSVRFEQDGTMTMEYNDMDRNEDTLVALGWGHTSERAVVDNLQLADVLQEALLGYVPNEECEKAQENFLSYQGRITEDMMCTFGTHRDTCFGDSGGPIILPGNSHLEDIQVGVVSWGEDCADPVFPGVAARVSYGYDWIQRWVCALDGQDAPEWFECSMDGSDTFSPYPTPAPHPPTISPAPTILTVQAVINIHFDSFATEIAWSLVESNSGQIVAQRPYGYYEHDNEVEELVTLIPGEEYSFTIKDIYGDGIINRGYYQILSSSDGSVLVHATGLFGREDAHTFQAPFLSPSTPPTPSPSRVPIIDTHSESILPLCTPVGLFCSTDHDCCSQVCKSSLCQPSPRDEQRIHNTVESMARRSSNGGPL